MDQSEVVSWAAIALSAATAVFGVINHRRLRSHCCGKNIEASLDVEATTPPGPKPELQGYQWQTDQIKK